MKRAASPTRVRSSWATLATGPFSSGPVEIDQAIRERENHPEVVAASGVEEAAEACIVPPTCP